MSYPNQVPAKSSSQQTITLKKIIKELVRPFRRLLNLEPLGETSRFDFSQYRMPTWEEDISRHHNSLKPFRNAPAPSEMPLEFFNRRSRLTDELLDGTPLSDFVARDTYPIPHEKDREEYQLNNDARYYLNGLAEYLRLRNVIEQHNVELNSYFDFGSASGRILRHFCAQSDVKNLWGCDLNGRHIKWMNDYLPSHLKAIHNHCLPVLPIADNSMDVITAYSVFTHIDTFETAWLAELHRILKPDGIAYLSVQNEDSWAMLQEAKTNERDDHLLNRLRNNFSDIDELLESDIPGGYKVFRYRDVGPYRALVFHSNDYLEKTWGRFFDILEIKPRWSGVSQSVLVARKR